MRLLTLSVLLALSINAFAQNSKINDSSFKLTDEMRSKLISASKNNGKLDYWSQIKGHEFEGERIEPDWYVAKEDAAIIRWTYDLTTSGLKDKNAIISLYEDLKRRKVSKNELAYINYGYNKAIARQ